MRVLLEQGTRTVEVLREADNLELCFAAKRFAKPTLDKADGERRDIDADPTAPELLRGMDGGAQPQKGSRTRSPGLDEAEMMRSRRATGFWVG
jgi:hypothetical protein